ncbi:1,4-dihydroxy-2-naphthoate polyprenyltransferase [Barnesiella intestinihominis]|uniref:1,4-dihydroxy-2-naphthoate polyprenyltransferase n=1 Tax=Barnesiella intestinihominis TaxID=487174 RepID=UPI003A90ADF7
MVKDWISAARPRTLPASTSPVIAASAYAFYAGTFRWVPAVLCLLFALLAQVASNMANDYFDYVKGSDKAGRVGPRRAVASGDITPRAMLMGTFCVLGVACAVGLGLVFFAGWQLIPIGVIIALFALAYTAGPYPLAYHGLGDVTVFLFFGLVAVNMTYYVQALQFDADVFLLSIAMGLLSINILLVNNYRDMEEDAAANKRTTVVLFGRRFALWWYFVNGVVAVLLLFPCLADFGIAYIFLPAIVYLFLHIKTGLAIKQRVGEALNPLLGATARNLLVFTILVSVVWICKGLGL